MGRVPGQGADGFHNLPAFPGHGNVHPGPSVRHRPTALLRPQEHLRLSCVSRREALLQARQLLFLPAPLAV